MVRLMHIRIRFKNKIMPIANEKEVHIVVDFHNVDYMDSTGLGVL